MGAARLVDRFDRLRLSARITPRVRLTAQIDWFAKYDLVKPTEMSVVELIVGNEPMSTPNTNNVPPPTPGLPPVQPPSGRFIVQLFVVPGLIIGVVVLFVLALSYWKKREREPNYFLNQLDSDNADIRWRGASDLSQILKRQESATLRWKADPKFALDLAERLDLAFKRLVEEESRVGAEIARSNDKDKHLLWRKLRVTRDHVSFLASALGEFHVPAGVPILCEMLKHDKAADINGNALQRRKALWSLMNMGENMKGYATLSAEHRAEIVKALKEEAAKPGTPRAGWALTALYYLDKSALPAPNPPAITKVETALAFCADADDRFLRELTAMAFNFWDGDQAEAILLKLANDKGHGSVLRVEESD